MRSLLLLFFVLASSTALSQVPFIYQNLNAINRDVQYISDSTLVVVGDGGKIIRTDNGAKSWRWQECHLRVDFKKVHFLNTQIGYVVGDSGVILRTENGGESWTTSRLTVSALYGVYTISTSVAVVVGANGSIFRTKDAGKTWANVYSDISTTLNDVQFVDQSFGTSVGTNGVILRTLDGGLTWKSIYNQDSLLDLTRVKFVNQRVGYIAGGSRRSNDSLSIQYYVLRILRTVDGGVTWSIQGDTTNTRQVLGLAAIDTIHAVTTTYSSLIFRTTNSGTLWQQDTLDLTNFFIEINRPRLQINGVSFLDPLHGVLVGEDNLIALTKDSGKTWVLNSWARITTYQQDYWVQNITFPSENNGFILLNAGRILQTPDGGVTSMQRFPTIDIPLILKDALWAAALFTSPTNGAVFGSDRDGGNEAMVARTNDGGYSWTRTDEVSVFSASFPTISRGFGAYTSPKVQRTDDGGLTWLPLKNYQEKSATIRSFISSDIGFITSGETKLGPNGYYFVAKMYRTKDGGDTFDEVFADSSFGSINSVVARDSNTVFCAGNFNGRIVRSNDKGQTWNWQTVPTSTEIQRIYFHNNRLGFMTLKDNFILVTTDGGNSWNLQAEPFVNKFIGEPNNLFLDIRRGANDSTIYFMGPNRFVRCIIPKELRTSAVEEPKVAEGTFNPYFYITTNPIPALSTINVTLYGLYSVKNKPLTVKVYDVLGYEVADFSREANSANNGSTSTFRADVGQLGAGVYILQYSAGGYSKSGLFMVGR